ncbi:MAG: 30S ribosomal protein S12 methylthiotransferase RimO, partial [Clostridia bacterium]|nr:30S ribosomal protein S12 methylthiotransferase RimO [Clostridia bacterium]
MKNKVKIGFVSLGCAKNLVDTEIMLHHVADAGYEITPDETEADVVIINTCGFIESAKREAIDNILDVAWLKENRDLKAIIVTGCLAERYREEIMREMPEIDAALGTGSIHSIVSAVEAVLRGEKFAEFLDQEKIDFGGDRVVTTGDTFAYLKISEGCRNRCTYCAIPLIR